MGAGIANGNKVTMSAGPSNAEAGAGSIANKGQTVIRFSLLDAKGGGMWAGLAVVALLFVAFRYRHKLPKL